MSMILWYLCRRSGLGTPRNLQAELDVLLDRAPREGRLFLKDHRDWRMRG